MSHLFVRHTVENFDTWKSAYDEDAVNRQSFGLKEIALHRGAENANDVTAVFELESLARGREFAASDDLKETMMKAGVQGMPEIWFTD